MMFSTEKPIDNEYRLCNYHNDKFYILNMHIKSQTINGGNYSLNWNDESIHSSLTRLGQWLTVAHKMWNK